MVSAIAQFISVAPTGAPVEEALWKTYAEKLAELKPLIDAVCAAGWNDRRTGRGGESLSFLPLPGNRSIEQDD